MGTSSHFIRMFFKKYNVPMVRENNIATYTKSIISAKTKKRVCKHSHIIGKVLAILLAANQMQGRSWDWGLAMGWMMLRRVGARYGRWNMYNRNTACLEESVWSCSVRPYIAKLDSLIALRTPWNIPLMAVVGNAKMGIFDATLLAMVDNHSWGQEGTWCR